MSVTEADRTIPALDGVTVDVDDGCRAAYYAGHWLERLGVSIAEGADVSITPGGSKGTQDGTINLWDFQVGRAGSGHLATASSGAGTVIGVSGSPAGTLPVEVPEKWCGLYGAVLALAECWRGSEVTERPRYDVSSADVLRAFALQNSGTPEERARLWRRNGRVPVEHGGIFPMGFFRCQVGYVALLGRSKRDWVSIRRALDAPSWAEEERFQNPFTIARDSSEADCLLESTLNRFTRDELLSRGLEYGAVIAPVYAEAEAQMRDVFRDGFNTPSGPALPFIVENAPKTLHGERFQTRGPAPRHLPLAGLRVLELCWVWAGPMGGQTLADLGAEVIKIESERRFDLYRTRGLESLRGKMPEDVRLESSLYFHSLNRNKVGLTLDLKSERGMETMRALIARSDILLDNFTVGTLDRLGLDKSSMFAANPRLSVVSMSGPGQGSKLAALRSYGLVLSALGGIEQLIEVDGEFVGSPAYSLSDPNAALFATMAALGGALSATVRDRGVALDVSQIEAVGTLAGTVPPSPGPTYVGLCVDTGEEIALSVPSEQDAAALKGELDGKPMREVMAQCAALGIAWCPVLELTDTDASNVFDLDGWLDAEHAITGSERLVAAPWRTDGQRPALIKPAPLLGEGNDYVQRQVLEEAV